MRKFLWILVAWLLFFDVGRALAYKPHDPGCHTRACDYRVDEAWADWEYEIQTPGHRYYPNGKPDDTLLKR